MLPQCQQGHSLCVSTSSTYTISRPWDPYPTVSTFLPSPCLPSWRAVAISSAPPLFLPFFPRAKVLALGIAGWSPSPADLVLIGSSPVPFTLPMNTAWAAHSTFQGLHLLTSCRPPKPFPSLARHCGSGTPVFSHSSPDHSVPAGLFLPLL